MVEVISALAGHLAPGRNGQSRTDAGVTLQEVAGRDLVQIGWWRQTEAQARAATAKELGLSLGEGTRRVSENGSITVFPVGPDKLWIAAPATAGLYSKLSAAIATNDGTVTELGHARTVIRLSGASARDVLARNVAVDLDPSVFPPGSFASTGIHGVGMLMHYVRDASAKPVFDLYLPRTFALSLFEGLCHTANAFGYEIVA